MFKSSYTFPYPTIRVIPSNLKIGAKYLYDDTNFVSILHNNLKGASIIDVWELTLVDMDSKICTFRLDAKLKTSHIEAYSSIKVGDEFVRTRDDMSFFQCITLMPDNRPKAVRDSLREDLANE